MLFARLMSGWRWRGSFSGSGRRTILERELSMSTIMVASSRIVNSFGLPMLIGPVTSSSVAIRRIKPSTRSST